MPRSDDGTVFRGWAAGGSLTTRILAVNIIALAMLAGGFFYLDSFRSQLVGHRQVTDSYLLGLAMRKNAKVATFDRGLASLLEPNYRDTDSIELLSAN